MWIQFYIVGVFPILIFAEPLRILDYDAYIPVNVKPKKDFSFATYYGDHMVLQRGPSRANVWGYTPSGNQRVELQFNGKIYTTTSYPGPTDSTYVWLIALDSTITPGPYTLVATSGGKTINITDVLFGDVWLCSGQSNMEFTLSMLKNGSDEIKISSNYSNVRVFTAGTLASFKPLYDFESILLHWSRSSPASVGGPKWTYFSAVCWLYGKALYEKFGYPIGMIESCVGGTPIERWISPDVFNKCNIQSKAKQDSSLWNGMIHPLLNMTMYGAIWYQGESNALQNKHLYNCTFPSMIDDWRLKFSTFSQTSSQFPFGFVQLAPYDDLATGASFAEIRWHQTADYGYVPNPRMKKVFMSVAMDLPDFHSPWGSIHPRYKYEIVDRLVLSSLAVAYNFDNIKYKGPFPSAFNFDKAKGLLGIVFDRGETVIEVRQRYFWNFEVYCGNSWYPAPIVYNTDSSIFLSTYICILSGEITYVRYSWFTTPCLFKMCTVYDSKTKLPAPPFIVKVH